MRKGLLVHVLTDPHTGGCTNGGITTRHHQFILTGDGVEGPFTPDESVPELRLVRRNIGRGEYLHAEPVEAPRDERTVGPMFGGNFITTSDSRFPNRYPIPVHDRWESPALNEALSR
jgi:hypothetical protein